MKHIRTKYFNPVFEGILEDYSETISGSWQIASSYADTNARPGHPGILITTGGTVYRIHHNVAGDIQENGVDSTYNNTGGGIIHITGGVLVDDAKRYVLYVDTSDDVHLILNDGGWNDEGVPLVSQRRIETDVRAGNGEEVVLDWR